MGNVSLANNLIHRTGQARWGLMRTTLVNQLLGEVNVPLPRKLQEQLLSSPALAWPAKKLALRRMFIAKVLCHRALPVLEF